MKTTMLIAMLTAAVPAFAGPDGGRGGRRMFDPAMLERAAEKIGVDDATLQKIKDRAHRGRTEAVKLEAELKTQQLELRHLLDQPRADRAKVMQAVERTGQSKIKLKKHHLEVMLDIREMLSPDQIKRLKELKKDIRKERREARKRWRQNRHEPRGDQPEGSE